MRSQSENISFLCVNSDMIGLAFAEGTSENCMLLFKLMCTRLFIDSFLNREVEQCRPTFSENSLCHSMLNIGIGQPDFEKETDGTVKLRYSLKFSENLGALQVFVSNCVIYSILMLGRRVFKCFFKTCLISMIWKSF